MVKWSKNYLPLADDNNHKIDGKTLIIENADINNDSGVYSCKSTNKAGTINSSAKILNLTPRDGSIKPFLDKTFKTESVIKTGGSVNLPCSFSSFSSQWSFGRLLINRPSNNIFTTKNGSLVIKSVQKKNEGIYICSNGRQQFASQIIISTLGKFDKNSIFPQNKTIYAPEGSHVEVRCKNPGGIPYPSIHWQDKNGRIIPERSLRMSDKGVLNFPKIKPGQDGNFSCIARNIAGERELKVKIYATVLPEIIVQPNTVRVAEGGTATFSCKITGSGFPVSNITWMRGGTLLFLESTRYNIDMRTGHLTIRNVRPTDESNYNCIIVTRRQKEVVTSKNANLHIIRKLKFKPRLRNQTLDINEEHEIICKIESGNKFEVLWKRDGLILSNSKSLFFRKITKKDIGFYTCVIKDKTTKLKQTIYIDVGVKPRFLNRPENKTAFQDHPLMIHCKTKGDPQPKITWYKENQLINDDRIKTLSNGSLYIKKIAIEDSGKYECGASNNIGYISKYIYVTVSGGDSYMTAMKDNDVVKTVIIAGSCALAYLAVVIGVTVYCSIRVLRNKRQRKRGDGTDSGESCTQLERMELMKKEACGYDSSLTRSDTYSQNSVPIVNYPRADLQTLRVLGKGSYGDIFLARSIRTTSSLISGSDQNSGAASQENVVLVKSLLEREISAVKQYRKEVSLLARCRHQNIVAIYGVCEEVQPFFLVTEYCEWGDLKQFLLAMRPENRTTTPLTHGQRLTVCAQISSACEHIAAVTSQGHGDISARNVLLTSRLDVKLSIVTLSGDAYSSEYVNIAGRRVPLRWASPESILSTGQATISSDIWSFGVFMWEVFTDAELPYIGHKDEDLLQVFYPHSQGSAVSYDSSSISAADGIPALSWATAVTINARDVALLVSKCCELRVHERPSFQDIWTILGAMIVDSSL